MCYADDTQLFLPLDMDNTAMSTVLCSVSNWMSAHGLSMNNDKTELIVFSSSNQEIFSLDALDTTINSSQAVRDLGFTLDCRLTLEQHVNAICRLAYMHIRNISSIRKCISKQACESLVHALVTSRLDFGNSLLCNLPAKTTRKLQRVQNSAARLIVCGSRTRREHITPVLQDLHWLPVVQRIAYKVLLFVHRAIYGNGPAYLKDLIQIKTPVRVMRSSDAVLLEFPPDMRRRRTKYALRTFSWSGPMLWNSLPSQLRSMSEETTFRRHLKTHLFRQYYF